MFNIAYRLPLFSGLSRLAMVLVIGIILYIVAYIFSPEYRMTLIYVFVIDLISVFGQILFGYGHTTSKNEKKKKKKNIEEKHVEILETETKEPTKLLTNNRVYDELNNQENNELNNQENNEPNKEVHNELNNQEHQEHQEHNELNNQEPKEKLDNLPTAKELLSYDNEDEESEILSVNLPIYKKK